MLLEYRIEHVFPVPHVTLQQSCRTTAHLSGGRSISDINYNDDGSRVRPVTIHESSAWADAASHATADRRSHASRDGQMDVDTDKDVDMETGPPVFTLQHVQYINFEDVARNYALNGCEELSAGREDLLVLFTLTLTLPGAEFSARRSVEFLLGKLLLRHSIYSSTMGDVLALHCCLAALSEAHG